MNNKDCKTTCTMPEPVEGTTVGASTSSATEGKTTRLLAFSFWLLAFGFFVSSCSTNKETSSIKMMSANHIIREIDDNQFDFDNLEAKIGVSVKGDNKLGLKGQMRIQNDSVIWISLSLKVGIEVGRIMITPDSIKYINRNTRTYLAESLDYFENKLPIEPSIQFIQDLLTGNDTQIKRSDKYRVTIENGKYKLETTKKIKNSKDNEELSLLTKDVWVMPETFKISEYEIKELSANERKLQIKYDEFQNVNGKLMPSKIIFETVDNYKFSIEINYSDIKAVEKLEFPFNISSKFEQILLW